MNAAEELRKLFLDYMVFTEGLPVESTLQKLFMSGPRSCDHPGHTAFYEAVEKWALQLAEQSPTREQLLQVLEVLLFEAENHRDSEARWFMVAAQRHALPLIPLLAENDRVPLAARFEKAYPSRNRMPVQEDILHMLSGTQKKRGLLSSFFRRETR